MPRVSAVRFPSQEGLRHDLLIIGATVVDGTGHQAMGLNVGVSRGHIAYLGTGRPPAREVLAADGLLVAPGFIDIHSHADFTLPANPGAVNSILQGVTTAVVGNCGWSPAPLGEGARRLDYISLAAGLGPDLSWEWTSFDEYLRRLEEAHPAVNCVPLVGHHALRTAVIGATEVGATSSDLDAMRDLLQAALGAGAWGLSSGLTYPPGCWSDRRELGALVAELPSRDRLYASHIRDEGDELISALEEALGVAEAVGVRLQISHLKAAGIGNHGRMGEALRLLGSRRTRGLDVHYDVYPYEATSTFLTQLLPPWALAGGVESLLARLLATETRDQIRRQIEHGFSSWTSQIASAGGWDNIIIASTTKETNAWARGRSIAELARDRRVHPADLVIDLLVEDHAGPTMIAFMMDPADVQAALREDIAAIGSDELGVTGPEASVHPRCYGTFARVLGPMVREGTFTLEDAVRRMTGLPAGILGLVDRGRVAPGATADLAILDSDAIQDRATYRSPSVPAVGIRHVLIGGQFAVRDGRVLNTHLGRVLRHPA